MNLIENIILAVITKYILWGELITYKYVLVVNICTNITNILNYILFHKYCNIYMICKYEILLNIIIWKNIDIFLEFYSYWPFIIVETGSILLFYENLTWYIVDLVLFPTVSKHTKYRGRVGDDSLLALVELLTSGIAIRMIPNI